MRDAKTTGLVISYVTFNGGGANFVTVELDVSLKESHTLKSEVTEYPVEDGMPYADGVRPLPREFSADVLHSTTPFVPGKKPDAERDRKMAAELIALRDARVPCTLTTEDGVLENMMLTDISWSRSVETGEAFLGTLSFKQILVASRQTVAIPKPVRPPVNRGAQQGALYSEANQVCSPTDSGMSDYDVPQSRTTPFNSATQNQVTRQAATSAAQSAGDAWKLPPGAVPGGDPLIAYRLY